MQDESNQSDDLFSECFKAICANYSAQKSHKNKYSYQQTLADITEAIAQSNQISPAACLEVINTVAELEKTAAKSVSTNVESLLEQLLERSWKDRLSIDRLIKFAIERITNRNTILGKGQLDFIRNLCLPLFIKMANTHNYPQILYLSGSLHTNYQFKTHQFELLFEYGTKMLPVLSSQRNIQHLEAILRGITMFISISEESVLPGKTKNSIQPQNKYANEPKPSVYRSYSYAFLTLSLSYFSIGPVNQYQSYIKQLIKNSNIGYYLINAENHDNFDSLIFQALITIYTHCNSELKDCLIVLIKKVVRLKINSNMIRTILKLFRIESQDFCVEMQTQRIFEVLEECRKFHKNKKVVAEFVRSSSMRKKIPSYPCVIEIRALLKHLIGYSTVILSMETSKSTLRLVLKIVSMSNFELNIQELINQKTNSSNCLRKFQRPLQSFKCFIEFSKERIELYCLEQECMTKYLTLQMTCKQLIIGNLWPETHETAFKELHCFKVYRDITLSKLEKIKDYEQSQDLLLFAFSNKKNKHKDLTAYLQPTFHDLIHEIGGIDVFFIITMHFLHFSNNEQLINKVFSQFEKISADLPEISKQKILEKCLCLSTWILTPLNTNSIKYSPFLIFNLLNYLPQSNHQNTIKMDFLCRFVIWRRQIYQFQKIILNTLENLMRQMCPTQKIGYFQLILLEIMPNQEFRPSETQTEEDHTEFHRMAVEFIIDFVRELMNAKFTGHLLKFLIFLIDLIYYEIKKMLELLPENKPMKKGRSFKTKQSQNQANINCYYFKYETYISWAVSIVAKITNQNYFLKQNFTKEIMDKINYLLDYFLLAVEDLLRLMEASISKGIISVDSLFHLYLKFNLSVKQQMFTHLEQSSLVQNQIIANLSWRFVLDRDTDCQSMALQLEQVSRVFLKAQIRPQIIQRIVKAFLLNDFLKSFFESTTQQIRTLEPKEMQSIVSQLQSRLSENAYRKIAALVYRQQYFSHNNMKFYQGKPNRVMQKVSWLVFLRNFAEMKSDCGPSLVCTRALSQNSKSHVSTEVSLSMKDKNSQASGLDSSINSWGIIDTLTLKSFSDLLEFLKRFKPSHPTQKINDIYSAACSIEKFFQIEDKEQIINLFDLNLIFLLISNLEECINFQLKEYLPKRDLIKHYEKTKKKPHIEKFIELRHFIAIRRKSILQINNCWKCLEQNNSAFWAHFIKSESTFQQSDFINSFMYKPFIAKRSKMRRIDLPCNELFNSHEINNLPKELIRQQIYQIPFFEQNSKNETQEKLHTFNVLYVTNYQTYQGKLSYKDDTLRFQQNELPLESFFVSNIISPSQQRKFDQIIFQPKNVCINIKNTSTRIMLKRYLCEPKALQINTQNHGYFFTFENIKQRSQFIDSFEGFHFKKILNSNVEKQTEHLRINRKSWQAGIISNFQYLMLLNDFAGRSFNDTSQYFIFPWTVTNFQADTIEDQFLNNSENFRRLNLPIGQCNAERFSRYKQRYQNAKKTNPDDAYLYGLFYSNPAIVCNYMIRIDPFSTYHFVLQSEQFDSPDRLFWSVENSWLATESNFSDLRELIPQFYFCSQFLRNRSNYKFGQRKGKCAVSDVILPNWVRTKTSQQLIFKMRRCLQCKTVTRQLHKWIDNIFGMNTLIENGEKSNNLYMKYFYPQGSKVQSGSESKDFQLSYYKEFGQVPYCLFDFPHKASHIENYSRRKYSKEDLTNEKELMMTSYSIEEVQHFSEALLKSVEIPTKTGAKLKKSQFLSRIIQSKNNSEQTLILSESSLSFYSLNNKCTEKKLSKNSKHFEYLSSATLMEAVFVNNLSVTLLFTIQSRQIYCYELEKALFYEENADFGKKKHILELKKATEVCSIKNCLILINLNEISFYLNGCFSKDDKKLDYFQFNNLEFKKLPYLNCSSTIVKLSTSPEQSLVFFVDSCHNARLLLVDNSVKQLSNFSLKQLFLSESILDVQIHVLNVLIVLCKDNRILVYNYFGENIVDCVISFEKEPIKDNVAKNNPFNEKITSLVVWNKQSSEIVLGTDFATIWKVDIFDDLAPLNNKTTAKQGHDPKINHKEPYRSTIGRSVQKCLQLKSEAGPILQIILNRIGRNYQMIVLHESYGISELTSKNYRKATLPSIMRRSEED